MRKVLVIALVVALASELTALSGQTEVRYRWRNVAIVGGGFVTGIIFGPAEAGLIYARTDIGGAYRWDPVAKIWNPLTDWVGPDDWNLLGIESIAADPNDANRVYAAAGTYTQSWAGNGAILASSDRGETWRRADMPFKMGANENGRSIGERLAVDPLSGNVLYFGSRQDGLWRSTDYAATWRREDQFPVTGTAGGVGIGFVIFDPRGEASGAPTQTIYAGVAAPVPTPLYSSADAGATWAPVPGQPAGLVPHHAVVDTSGVLYVTYGNGPGPNDVTGGAVWKLDTTSGVWTNITPPKSPTWAQNCGYAGLSLDRRRPGTLMVSTLDRWWPGDEIFRSTDGGAHWTPLGARSSRDSSLAPFLNWGASSAALGHWIGDLEIDPFDADHVLYVTGATIWGTNDMTALDSDQMTHWTVAAEGLEETAVQDLVSLPSGPGLLSALGDLGGLRHDDLTVSPPGGLWTNPVFSTGTSLDFAEAAPAFVARVGYGSAGHGAYSLDGAMTWTPFAAEPAGPHEAGSVAVSADGGTMVWTPNSNFPFYSRTRGATWTQCAGLPSGVRVVSDRVNPSRFYAFNQPTGVFYVSDDGAAGFSPAAQEVTAASGARLAVSPSAEGDVWLVAGTAGLGHWEATGAHFDTIVGVEGAYALGFGASSRGRASADLYLFGQVRGVMGVYRSEDDGVSWARINDEAHQYGWIGPAITGDRRVPGRVYLGTNGRGVIVGEPACKRACGERTGERRSR